VIDRLFLVRHGETVDNARGITQGWNDSELSDTGRRQVQALARRIETLAPTAIFTSSLPRAVATAEAIAAQTGLGITPLDDLREINCGRWEGLSFLDVRQNEPDLYQRWIADPAVACPGGESHLDLARRLERALEAIRGLDEDRSRPVVVSHGMAIRVAATVLLGFALEAYRNFAQSNAALNVFAWRGERFILTLWNDTAHLAEGVS
jgi:ribonuclease H / adenosylcobalamin/alpha-ribazole phosphatase